MSCASKKHVAIMENFENLVDQLQNNTYQSLNLYSYVPQLVQCHVVKNYDGQWHSKLFRIGGRHYKLSGHNFYGKNYIFIE